MEDLTENVVNVYDRCMYLSDDVRCELRDDSDYTNFGFWNPDTMSPREAGDNLMEELLRLIPAKRGKILDVACGKGATTRYLTQYYDSRNIVGINISEKQLATCRKNAPGCRFLKMTATELGFEDKSFDAAICVEAACHFKTRARFLQEAYRVLRPGGSLVLSDVLHAEWWECLSPVLVRENHVDTLFEYKILLRRSGFVGIVVEDVTKETYGAFVQYLLESVRRMVSLGRIDFFSFRRAIKVIYLLKMVPVIRRYLLVGAQKPYDKSRSA